MRNAPVVYKPKVYNPIILKDNSVGKVKNLFSPLGSGIGGSQLSYVQPPSMRPPDKKDLRTYISPVQFARVRSDVSTIRDAISEAEQGFYPHRVKLQRIFMDVADNPHILACVMKRRRLTLLRDFHFQKPDESIDEETTKLFKRAWFRDCRIHAFNAKLYGYTLIQIPDIDKDLGSPKGVSIVQREHCSPDRKNVTTFIYSIGGVVFENDIMLFDPAKAKNYTIDSTTDPEITNHAIWVPTISEQGHSVCGYGMFYQLAIAAVFLRNNLGYNADYTEMFAQPFRHAKTHALPKSPEWNTLAALLQNMGNSGYALTGMNDIIDFIDANKSGTGYQSYDNFEKRLKNDITAVILGHSMAMAEKAGHIGSQQGGNESPEQIAMREIQTEDGHDDMDFVNNNLIPKLRNLGMNIPEDSVYVLTNDDEVTEAQKKQNDMNLVFFNGLAQAKTAGIEIEDMDQIKDATGLDMIKAELPAPAEPAMKVVKNFYDRQGKA